MFYTPLFPQRIECAGIHQFHVEVRGEDEGKKSHRGGPHQVQDGSEAWDGLRYEEKDEDRQAPEHTSLPVEICELDLY